MSRLRTFARAATAALLGSVVLSGCEFNVYDMPLPGGADTGEDPIEVTVEFADVLDLVPKSSVKVSDVTVGQVTDIELDGQTAVVTLELRDDTDLPDNAVATIRQTSLLGEKFVSLDAPATGASDNALSDGDVIPLSATGRNPEVEEVLGALSLLLNGGGVAQLKTITNELNLALEGREDAARSVLTQFESLMSQLDERKQEIVDAIESVNRLAITVRRHQPSIDQALEELPSALDSIARQRRDLVRMLEGLNRLGDVGVRVIRQTEEATVDALRSLEPVLMGVNRAGQDAIDALNVLYLYPFSDDTLARDPQVARNIHQGDYVNLSIQMDLNLLDLQLPGLPCVELEPLQDLPLVDLIDACHQLNNALDDCVRNCANLIEELLGDILGTGGGARGNGGGGGGGGIGGGANPIEDLLGQLGLGRAGAAAGPGLGRAPVGGTPAASSSEVQEVRGHDADLVQLFAAPLVDQGGDDR